MEKVVKINLGSGIDYREGYTNVDNKLMFPDAKVDVISDIQDHFEPDNTVDEILLSHVVMYLRPSELRPLLFKWVGWLKEGGQLIIETADVKKLCRIVAESSDQDEVLNHGLINLFGTDKTGPHTWGWYPQILIQECLGIGFSDIYIEQGDKKPKRDFKLIATK